MDDAGALSFHRLDPPQDADIQQLLDRIARRIDTLIEDKELPAVDDEHLAVAQAQGTSLLPRASHRATPHGPGSCAKPQLDLDFDTTDDDLVFDHAI